MPLAAKNSSAFSSSSGVCLWVRHTAKYSTAETPKLGHSASIWNMAISLTLPPIYHTMAIIVADTMETKAPDAQERFQKKAPTVGRNRPAELIVKVMSKIFIMS